MLIICSVFRADGYIFDVSWAYVVAVSIVTLLFETQIGPQDTEPESIKKKPPEPRSEEVRK